MVVWYDKIGFYTVQNVDRTYIIRHTWSLAKKMKAKTAG